MERSLQNRANDPALWEVLKHKSEKSLTSNTSCREDEIRSHHDDHQEDDAPLEGEKRVKRHKASKSSKSARGSSSKHSTKDSNTYNPSNNNKQEKDGWFKNAEEYAYHLEQTTNFMENQIVWESGQEDIRRPVPRPLVFFGPQRNPNKPPRITKVVRITIDQPHGLDFMEQIIMMRENDKSDSFSEADFKYLNKNDNEDLYYLCRNKKDQKKLQGQLITITEQEAMFWSKPSPMKQSRKKEGRMSCGGASNRRLSLGGAMLTPRTDLDSTRATPNTRHAKKNERQSNNRDDGCPTSQNFLLQMLHYS
ncbi:65-kDa microtubule-associated protein 3-like protein [Tanacetum coccineum]